MRVSGNVKTKNEEIILLQTCIVLLGVATALTFLFLTTARPVVPTGNDAAIYYRMSRQPFKFTQAPWGYRLLMPLIVHVLPVDKVSGFVILTIVSLTATAVLFFRYIASLLDARKAIFGVTLFVFSVATHEALGDPFLPDPLAYAFIVGMVYLLYRKRWFVLGVVLPVGILVKESAGYMLIPLIATALLHKLRPLKRWLGVIFPAIATYFLIHYTTLLFGKTPPNYSYLSLRNIVKVLRYQQQSASWLKVSASAIVRSYGPMWLLFPLGWRMASKDLKIASSLMMPTLASLLIANDWVRMLAYAFIFLIPLTVTLDFDVRLAMVFTISYGLLIYGVNRMPMGALKYVSQIALVSLALAIGLSAYLSGRTVDSDPPGLSHLSVEGSAGDEYKTS